MKKAELNRVLGACCQRDNQFGNQLGNRCLSQIRCSACRAIAVIIALVGWPMLCNTAIARTNFNSAKNGGIGSSANTDAGAVIMMQDLHAPSVDAGEMSVRIQQLLTAHRQQLRSQQQNIHQQIAHLQQQQDAKVKRQMEPVTIAVHRTATEKAAAEKAGAEQAKKHTKTAEIETEQARKHIEMAAAKKIQQQAAAAVKAAKKAEFARQIQEINQAIARLQRLQQEAMAAAQQAHEIITTQPNCQKFLTTRGWHNPCERIHPGYHRIHYADQQRKIADDDVYLCTKTAEPRESTQCLLTHILTDRNRGYITPERFTIPKRVRAYAIIKDFWRSSHLCITIHNKTRQEDVIRNHCFSENSKFPLPYSDSADQQFVLSFADNNGSNMGGVYIASHNVNIDRTPIERARQQMRQVIAETEPKITELVARQERLTEEMCQL